MNSSGIHHDYSELHVTPVTHFLSNMILYQVPSPVSKRIMVHVHCECSWMPSFDQVANEILFNWTMSSGHVESSEKHKENINISLRKGWLIG